MRAVIQRVLSASVSIDGETVASIPNGLLVLLGVEQDDHADDIEWLCGKIARMRIFADKDQKMNLSAIEASAHILVVSQFTLHASTRKGNRPSFIRAAHPSLAEPLYESFCARLESEIARPVPRGRFGADMKITLVNDGPVTIVIDSKLRE